mgnify:CR=1 FL=1
MLFAVRYATVLYYIHHGDLGHYDNKEAAAALDASKYATAAVEVLDDLMAELGGQK